VKKTSPAAEEPRSLRERVREATRQALLEAAEQTFAEQGIEGARIEDIAARAGIAVGTFYNYFQDRDDLLAALAAARRETLVERLDAAAAVTKGEPWQAQLLGFLRALLEHLESHRRFFSIILQAETRLSSRPPFGSAMDEVYERAERLIRRGIRLGILRRDEMDLLPSLLVGMLRAVLIRDRHVESPTPLPELAGPLCRLFLDGAAKS
jgi:AcrR family transcriptional regulator